MRFIKSDEQNKEKILGGFAKWVRSGKLKTDLRLGVFGI